MTMHARVDRRLGTESDALFFANVPDPALEQNLILPAVQRSGYGEGRKPNWPAILLIAALHVGLITALIKFDVIQIRKKAPELVVINISEVAPPPIVERPQQKADPDVAMPPVAAPVPIVEAVAPPPPQVVVAPPPPKPTPPAIVAPSGPMAVDNIDERLVEGSPPKYPLESRRKKEQGTVVLRVVIGTDGKIAQVAVSESSGFERLDKAAIEAVKRWRWQPWTRNGQPVEVRGLIPFPFVLKV